MKKIFSILLILFITGTYSFAATEDNSIIDELNKKDPVKLDFDFNLKTFKSCSDMETVMGNYIKEYYKANKSNFTRNYSGPFMVDDAVSVNVMEDTSDFVAEKAVSNENLGGSDDFSETNNQVVGVDESDIIKTDGEYIYYFNDKDNYIYIVKSYPSDKLEIVKKIKLPENFYSPVLYLGENRLVIIASGNYDNNNYGAYWINRNNKTYTIIFDTSDISNPKLLKLNISDGDFSKSRKIGDYVYVLSTNYFNIPYYNFKSENDINLEINNIIPKSLEISKTDDTSKQNLEIKGKDFPYSIKAGNVAKCSEIEYSLPDKETLKKYDFSPSYNIISIINIKNIEEKTKTKVIAGNNAEIYMSLDNLYLTSNLYQSYDFVCPFLGRCLMPYYSRGENTLIHKLNIEGSDLSYQTTQMIPGNPLTQYSMDEKDDYFRIITQKYYPERETGLYILDKNLKLAGNLTGLGKTEDFKSSRFMGDKLFLVTFKQIDPLFVIDLVNQTKPEVIGELKIPGYSTYLHPYDENNLIGIGNDTAENQYGGTYNNGVKVDLYEVNYDKKCGDANLTSDEQKMCDSGNYKGVIVKQKYSLNLGEYGSYSEALNNPRMFMWNKSKNTLLLPATLYKNDSKNYYEHKDFFNGLVGIEINKDTGIKEKYRITHIDITGLEDKRNKECSQYDPSSEPECVKLIGGGEYCGAKNDVYVPKYCYEGSTIGEYIANKSWDYQNDFVKRALWISDNVYSISNNKILVNDLDNGKNINDIELK